VPCPTCKSLTVYASSNPWRPFCSARCRNNDLGAWANEQFRVAAPTSAETPEDEPPAQDPGKLPH